MLDPSRITLYIGPTGIDGDTFKREQLMDRYGMQINKTSRNTVLFMTNIGTTRSSVAYLVEVLVKIARELDDQIAEMSLARAGRASSARCCRLTSPPRRCPTSAASTRPSATDARQRRPPPEGDMRRAFYLSYDDSAASTCTAEEIAQRIDAGERGGLGDVRHPVSAGLPGARAGPGVQPARSWTFMRGLDTPEIHGYKPEFGYRVYTDKAIEIAHDEQG